MKAHFLLFLMFLLTTSLGAQVFFEDWTDQNFDNWAFWPGQANNWRIVAEDGTPPPCLDFFYSPVQHNYWYAMYSAPIEVQGMLAPVLRVDVSLDNYSSDTLEQLTLDVRNANGDWVQLEQWDNQNGDINWVRKEYSLLPIYNGSEIYIRFSVSGQNSYNIDRWLIDNISVQEAQPMCTVSGSVTTYTPPVEPIENAYVNFGGWSALTDDQGQYSVDVPMGAYDGFCSAYGYMSATQSGLNMVGLSQFVSFQLQRLPVISGVVTDLLNDAPIEGAEVYAHSDNAGAYTDTHSAADGSYSFPVLGADDWEVTGHKEGEYQYETFGPYEVWGDVIIDVPLVPEDAQDINNDPNSAQHVDNFPFTDDKILYPSTDSDWFYFWGQPGATYTLWTELYNGGTVDPVISVTGPSSGPPFSDIDPYDPDWMDNNSGGELQPHLTFTVPQTHEGWFLAHVYSDDTPGAEIGYYRLHIEETIGPVASFSTEIVSGPAPLTVEFYDNSYSQQSTITEWVWDFDNDGTPDATYSTSTNPTWTYNTAGTYSVSLTVSDGAISNTLVQEDLVTVSGTVFPPGSQITGYYDDNSGVNTIEGDAYVPQGGTLELDGASFRFMPGAQLFVEGTLIVNGGSMTAVNQMQPWNGIRFQPTCEGCSMSNMSLVGAVPGVEIDGCMPEFHDVHLQMDEQFTQPEFGWAVFASNNAAPWFDDCHISGYDFGVRLMDIAPPGRMTPVFDDLLVECRDPSVAFQATGVLLQNATAVFNGLEVVGFVNGVFIDTWEGAQRSTPTLTNIRVRNSGNATRDEGVGLYMKDVSEVVVEGDSILDYSIGVMVETTEQNRDLSTPTLTNIRVRNSGNATRDGDVGLLILGNVSGEFRDLHFVGYNAGVEIAADTTGVWETAPQLSNMTIVADTMLVSRTPSYGLNMTGAVNALVDSLYIDGFPTGVIVENMHGGGTRSTPTLTNIRVRNSNNATRVDTVGVMVSGPVDAYLQDIDTEGFVIGLMMSNTETRGLSTPTLTNIRVRNSGNATRTETWGLCFDGAIAAQLNGAEVIDYTYGIHYCNFAGDELRSTPTLTNIRVRNSGNATREPGIGVWLDEVSEITVDGDSIVGYPIGIQVESVSGRDISTPTLTNIRVRNSGNATRPQNVGVQMLGAVVPVIDNLDIDEYDYGVYLQSDGTGTRSTPTLTNIRVRNSGNATREPQTGVTIIDAPDVLLQADSTHNYAVGYEIISATGAPVSYTAQNIVAHRDVDNPTRLEGCGLRTSDGVDGQILDSRFTGFGCGVETGDGTNNVQGGVFRNCDKGVEVVGGAVAINGNVFYLDDQYPPQRMPGPALHMRGGAVANLDNNTIHNYNTGVQADTSTVEMKQSIIWHNPPLPDPIVQNGGQLRVGYSDISYTQPVWGDGTNINADPQFSNPQQGDFHLGMDSPCIDCGDPNAPWDPEGNAPDIGACRYPHKADFTVAPRFATTGSPIQFTNCSIGHPEELTDFMWDFDNNGVPDVAESNPLYTFTQPGVYDILLVTTSSTLVDSAFHYHFCVYQEQLLNAPQGVLVSQQGADMRLSWQPVTHDTSGQPVVVDYYLVYSADDPGETFEFLGFSDGPAPAYTHAGALAHDRHYYFVLAFSGTSDERGAFVESHAAVRFESEGVRWISRQEKSARR